MLGINVDPSASPPALAVAGARWVRCVYRDWLPTSWLQELRDEGIEPVLVGDSSPDSLGDVESHWPGRMADARDRYGDLVRTWQWGNEPDGTGPASWTMGHGRLNRLLEAARGAFPSPRFTLVAPGMVSGNPSWLSGLRLELVDKVACHVYAKEVDTAEHRQNLEAMLSGYAWHGEVWVTEYDSRVPGLGAYLRDSAYVACAAVMCWSDAMTEGEGLHLGLLQNPAAMAEFQAAADGPRTHPAFALGFAQIAAAHPELVGTPRENESGPWPGCSLQATTGGILFWGDFVGVGSRMGFVGNDLTRYVWTGDHLEAR